jgi:hypothetical protein
MSDAPLHLEPDEAALHALNALDDIRRRAIDRHVGTCERCSRILGEAERDVATLAAAQPIRIPPGDLPPLRIAEPKRAPVLPVWSAAAAAFLLALIPSAYLWQQNQAMHGMMRTDAGAVARLAGTRTFRTVEFHGTGAGNAHVAYALDGSWYVVLVRGAVRPLQVAWMHDGARTMLGNAEPHGDVAILYLPNSHRMDRLALMDGERIVSEAQLAF